YVATYRELMEGTDWSRYGVGVDPKCDNCMAHCGFEGTAVEDTLRHPLKALTVRLRGPTVSGPMAPEVPFTYDERAHQHDGAGVREVTVPLHSLKRVSRNDASVGSEP